MTNEEAQKLLTEIYGEKITRFQCDFLNCVAGMGLAGAEYCFLGGKPEEENCEKFRKENLREL